nr:hypothetical protein [Tanacetum cinerariifolium]
MGFKGIARVDRGVFWGVIDFWTLREVWKKVNSSE